jgi:hypothetical protein
MKKPIYILLTAALILSVDVHAQKMLPEISVNNINDKIIISWMHNYRKKISDIFIQRSYDSLKNFTTIGTVLIPENQENGYPDNNPPYNRMYYRVSIIFEGGTYVTGPSTRPAKNIPVPIEDEKVEEKLEEQPQKEKIEPLKPVDSPKITITKPIIIVTDTASVVNPPKEKKPEVLASKNVYSNKKNNLIIELPDATSKKYSIKFFEESGKFLFEINKMTEEYLILEKVNFKHSGWFNFELYDQGKLIEKNKIFVPKDPKISEK